MAKGTIFKFGANGMHGGRDLNTPCCKMVCQMRTGRCQTKPHERLSHVTREQTHDRAQWFFVVDEGNLQVFWCSLFVRY